MGGTVLVIDALATNRIVLRVKLEQASYDVNACSTLDQARVILTGSMPDAIIAADNLPGLDAAGLCRTIREMAQGRHVPLIITTSEHNLPARLGALAVGADEVLERPLQEALLLSRMRCLIRDDNARVELQMRDATQTALGFSEAAQTFMPPAHVYFIATDTAQAENLVAQLQPELTARLHVRAVEDALRRKPTDPAPDVLVLLTDSPAPGNHLALLNEWRARHEFRHAGILVVLQNEDPLVCAQVLDRGANDLVAGRFELSELGLRITRQIRRKQTEDRLRAALHANAEAALVDPLTGTYNRRYAMAHLARTSERAAETGRPYSVMVADIDHFKRINDTFGHACGDQVLCSISRRLKKGLRAADMLARIGGEEFLVVMAETTLQEAQAAAIRLCDQINATPVPVEREGQTHALEVTISIGATLVDPGIAKMRDGSMLQLIDAADRALYAAKSDGRNQVLFHPNAA